jgi:hypothetical protein
MLAIYRTFKDLDFKKNSRTRYVYMFLVLERLLQVYPTLEKMVVCDALRAWQDSRTFEARVFKNLMFVDSFWSNAKNIVKDLQPFYIVFCLAHKEGFTMGLLYEFMLKAGDMFLIANMLLVDQLLQVGPRCTSRWEWFHHPIHVVAHILHPLLCHPLGNISHELQDGWKFYLNIHCRNPLDGNDLDDELLKLLWKEGPFA